MLVTTGRFLQDVDESGGILAAPAACSLLWRADVLESRGMTRVGRVTLSATFVSILAVVPRHHISWQVDACREA